MCWVLKSISLSTMRAVVLVCKFCKFESPFTSVVSVRHCWALGADNLFHTLQSRSEAYEIREYVSLWKHQHTSGILSISFSARSLQLVIPSFEVGFQSIHLWKGKKITKTSNATLKNQQEDVEFTSFAHTFSIDSLSLGVLRLGASSGLLHHRRNFQRLDSNGRVREMSELIIHNLHPNFSSQVPATCQCNIAHPAFARPPAFPPQPQS